MSHLFVQLRVPCITNLTANNRRQQGDTYKIGGRLPFSTIHTYSSLMPSWEGIRVHRPSVAENKHPAEIVPGRGISLSLREDPSSNNGSSRYTNNPA